MLLRHVLATLLTLISLATAAHAETVYLSAAASMTDAVRDIMARFSTLNPQVKLLANFASSGSLAKQIEQGAPVDIYISANPRWVRYLEEKQLVEPGNIHIFAHNTLVFIAAGAQDDLNIAGLRKLQRIALGTPQNVPAGQYAKQAMKNAGVYEPLEKNRKLIMAKDVRQALLYADRGEADGAFVYKTDAILATKAKIIFTVPSNLHDRISYPVALTEHGANKERARAFYEFMGSPEVAAILGKYGFQPAH